MTDKDEDARPESPDEPGTDSPPPTVREEIPQGELEALTGGGGWQGDYREEG